VARRLLVAFSLIALVGCRRMPRKEPLAGPSEWIADPVPMKSANGRLNAISGTSKDDVWAVGWGIFHWNGKAWSDETPPELIGVGTALDAIAVVAHDDVWAVGVNGQCAHFDGRAWHGQQLDVARVSENPSIKGHYDLIDVVAWPNEVWVTSASKGYYRFDGKTWSNVRTPELGVRTFHQVWGATSRDVWLVGGRMAHFDGASWDDSTVLPAGLRKAHGASSDSVWAVGWKGNAKDDAGAIFRFDGARWSESKLPANTPLLWSVHAASRDEAYAVGNVGWALAWDGSTWRPSTTGKSGSLRGVYAAGNGVAFAVGDIGPYVLRKR